jgi:hypothetical protein
MEPWEIELEFYTHEEHRALLNKANGTPFMRTEEIEVSEEDFKRDAETLMHNNGGEFDPTQWEEVKNG